MGIRHVKPELLEFMNWKAALIVLPATIISFGYHNLVPSLTAYLEHDKKKLVASILIGAGVPLLVYVVWQGVILGIVNPESFQSAVDNGEIATRALRRVVDSSWVTVVAEYFALFALVTSFLAIALSFVDFLADGLGVKKTGIGSLYLIGLTLVPPLVCAMLYPTIFLQALNYGAIGALLLFGVLPALMVWKGRYGEKKLGEVIVPGGRVVLGLVLIFSILIIAFQMSLGV
jgi:tyrosine-specific transport protein